MQQKVVYSLEDSDICPHLFSKILRFTIISFTESQAPETLIVIACAVIPHIQITSDGKFLLNVVQIKKGYLKICVANARYRRTVNTTKPSLNYSFHFVILICTKHFMTQLFTQSLRVTLPAYEYKGDLEPIGTFWTTGHIESLELNSLMIPEYGLSIQKRVTLFITNCHGHFYGMCLEVLLLCFIALGTQDQKSLSTARPFYCMVCRLLRFRYHIVLKIIVKCHCFNKYCTNHKFAFLQVGP